MSPAAAVLVALAIPIAPAAAQDPTPTPTPTPAPERSDAEEDVYRDYRRDGVIEACDHKRRTLRAVLEELPPEADVDNPDLRPALEAAIEQHDDGDCEGAEPTPTPEPTATPDATATPAPTATAAPTTSPDDPVDSGSVDPLPAPGGDSSPPSSPPGAEDVEPLAPEVTPVPPATTPAPATAAPEPSGPAVTPSPAYANADDELPVSLLVLAALLALVALLALLFATLSRLGWAERWLARPRRALREATFRVGGTWGDFADWLRLGR